MSRYGRVAAPEPLRNLIFSHRHDGSELKVADHEPPLCVLDQQTLVAQGITVAKVVAGARPGTNALGSCTANATTAHLSGILDKDHFRTFVGQMACAKVRLDWDPYSDAVVGEEAAIGLYHRVTDRTGTPSSEWPPTDCGSSGPYLAQECETLGLTRSQSIAHTPTDLVSLLQTGTVLMGSPFFFSFEEPDADGFVDGAGRAADLERAIESGVAGGHETCIAAVEALSLDASGEPRGQATVLRVRNSWGPSWGDHGDFRIHLSTLEMIWQHCDFRQLVA